MYAFTMREMNRFAAMHPRFDSIYREMLRLIQEKDAGLAGAYRVAYERRFGRTTCRVRAPRKPV